MFEQTSEVALISPLRRRAARIAQDSPTAPINLAQCVGGGLLVAGTLIAGAPWPLVAASLIPLITGIVGLLIVRTRFVMIVLRISLLGATLALLSIWLAFAPYPIWWLILVPLGSLLTGAVLYYWGLSRAVLWYLLEAAAVLIASLLARALPRSDIAMLNDALIAAEVTLLVTHLGVLLLLPHQAESEARHSAITQQGHEIQNLSLQISATADGLGRAASAIHMVTGQQSSGAEQQAAVITEAVAMLNQFIALADQVRDQARNVSELSETTTHMADRGQQAISTTVDGMSQIRAQVTVIAHNIAALAEQMQRIDEIIGSVSEIATQSNLLALNASIEAARAGAHGRGFAVVADEVRTLSQQSKEAAAQVQMILSEIQEAMKQTVRATELGDQQVDKGMALSQEAGHTITQLNDNVNQTAESMRSILVAIDQQATGLEQITQSMRNIHDVTQKNLESTRTAEVVAESLSRLSEELLSAIARYGSGLEEF